MVDQTPFVRKVGGEADAADVREKMKVVSPLFDMEDEVELDGRGVTEVWDEDEMDVVDEEGDDVLEAKVDDEDGKKLVLVMTVPGVELLEAEMEALGGIDVDWKSLLINPSISGRERKQSNIRN